MSYTALYRRYRPNRFDRLVGQEHIGRILHSAVNNSSFVHAYLFCGPRGTGKTSAAKIFARAVNCLNPNQGEPCGECAACLRDISGESMDIMEIDAASNRGIDEIRDLRERVKYSPAQEKYKVYIIDEVHMLTGEAFNALLKTLEEPPAHVIFILATTEPHKIPLTVLSRCQRFDFRRIGESDIAAHLLYIAEQEHIPLDPSAAALIARKAEGGMRDAVSLLDQCAAISDGQIMSADVAKMTGSVDRDFILSLIQALVEGDLAAALSLTEQLVREGNDIRAALHDLLEETRDLLLTRLGNTEDAQLPTWAAAISPAQLISLLQAFSDTDSRLRYSLQPRITFELALIKACSGKGQATAPSRAQPQPQSKEPLPTPAATPSRAKPQPPREQSYPGSTAAPLKTSSRFRDEDAPPPPQDNPDDLPPWQEAPVAKPQQQAVPISKPPQQQRPPQSSKPLLNDDDDPPWEEAADAANAPKTAQITPPPAKPTPPIIKTAPPSATVQTTKAAVTASSNDTAEPSNSVSTDIRELWPQILKQVYKANMGTYFFVAEAKIKDVSGGKLLLEFPPGYELHMESACTKPAHKDIIEAQILEAYGSKLSISGLIGKPQAPTATTEENNNDNQNQPQNINEEQVSLF